MTTTGPPIDHARTSNDERGSLAVARAIVEAAAGTEDTREQILGFIDAHPDALHRSCVTGHLTGSAFVVDAERRRTLLLFHTKLQMWLQPGGHADGDGDLARVALREATEETGIAGLVVADRAFDLDIHEVDPPKEPAHLHHDVRYVVTAPPGAQPVGNHESQALRWVPLEEVATLTPDQGILRMVSAVVGSQT